MLVAIRLHGFELRIAEAAYWVSRHADAGIELRLVQNLWPIIDAIVASGLEFSIIRKANAQPYSAGL